MNIDYPYDPNPLDTRYERARSPRCPFCDSVMTLAGAGGGASSSNQTYDAVMAGDWRCPDGCRPCEAYQCAQRAVTGPGLGLRSDCCLQHSYENAIEVMEQDGATIENQAEVARWRVALDRAGRAQ